MNDELKNIALQRLERFAIWVCTSAVLVSSWAMWENYKTNQRLVAIVENHDKELNSLKNQDAIIESKIIALESRMISMEMFKRIEQNLSILSYQNKSNEAMKVISQVLRTEIESKEKKQ